MNRFTLDEQAIPFGNGGGTCKTIADVEKLLKSESISMIEIGSITMNQRDGNTGDTFYSGMRFTLNSLGLPNPGYKYYEENLPRMVKIIHKAGKKVLVNVVGFTDEEYSKLTALAFACGADYVILNYGCPNVWVNSEQKDILSYDLLSLKKTTALVLSQNPNEASQGRIGIKLSPIVNPSDIKRLSEYLNELAQNSDKHIGFITTMNTVPNCYFENEDGEQSITVGEGLAGMAGESVLPVAKGQVKQFRALLDESIKIIGVGGVSDGKSMKQMLNSGADFVQMASAYYKNEDPFVFERTAAEYAELSNIEI